MSTFDDMCLNVPQTSELLPFYYEVDDKAYIYQCNELSAEAKKQRRRYGETFIFFTHFSFV